MARGVSVGDPDLMTDVAYPAVPAERSPLPAASPRGRGRALPVTPATVVAQRRRRARRILVKLLRFAGAGAVVWAIVAGWPQLRAATAALGSADRSLIALALISQLAALAFLGLTYRAALAAAGANVAYRQAGGVALRAAAVSRLLPGGGAAAAVFAIGRLRRGGVADGAAVAGVAVNGVVTMTMLAAVIAGIGGASTGRSALLAVAAAAAVAVLLRRRIRDGLGVVAGALRQRRSLATWGAALDTLAAGPLHARQVFAAAGFAAAAWTCELTALWLAVAGVAQPLPVATVAVGLGAANAAAAVPHTPGGVGVVEVAMTAAFATTGLDASLALGGVLAYRAVGFWLPVAVGMGLLGIDRFGRSEAVGDETRPGPR